ncbi:hypothetical protein BDR03DRAFT_966414 [Suillus americanus]|nr:hypothetical protein BDR03DRAFT_966414 [Suillus americanus]
MESTSDKPEADSSTQQSQAVAGPQGSQVEGQSTPMTQAKKTGADTGESLCVIGCCGLWVRLSSTH